MEITYKTVKGGLKDIPSNNCDYGIVTKLLNRANEKTASKQLIARFHEQTNDVFELDSITVCHKPYSIYKWLIIKMKS